MTQPASTRKDFAALAWAAMATPSVLNIMPMVRTGLSCPCPSGRELIGDPESGVLASGPILTLMDMATSLSVWTRLGRFCAHATLDLRIDYLRPAAPGKTVIARGDCYRITRSIAFIRGQAHDGDPDDPLAHVAGTFMAPEGYR